MRQTTASDEKNPGYIYYNDNAMMSMPIPSAMDFAAPAMPAHGPPVSRFQLERNFTSVDLKPCAENEVIISDFIDLD